jgi:hypothetical protein
MWRATAPVVMALALSACVPLPDDVFVLTPELLKQRQIETRRYSNITEEALLVASANVLQDLGYNLENSETKLGVLTASKQRDATNPGEIVAFIIIAALGGGATPISKDQTIRVSLVVRPVQDTSAPAVTRAASPAAAAEPTATPLDSSGNAESPGTSETLVTDKPPAVSPKGKEPAQFVRVTFQRIVRRTDNSEYAETLRDPALMQEFFSKLSTSIFLEGQQI